MKFYQPVGVFVFIASASFGQQRMSTAKADQNIMGADTEKVRQVFAAEVVRLKPDVSAELLERNSDTYIKTIPDIQKTLRGKSCAGQPCSSRVLNQALVDVYVITTRQKDYVPFGPIDVGETVSNTSYVSVWSDPPEADFSLLQGSTPVWVEKTNNERFIPKGDYKIHIEKTGYQAFEGPCSNKRNEGTLCGATLKKKTNGGH